MKDEMMRILMLNVRHPFVTVVMMMMMSTIASPDCPDLMLMMILIEIVLQKE
jgi:hypothetical protein